jgi:hypothetical protein
MDVIRTAEGLIPRLAACRKIAGAALCETGCALACFLCLALLASGGPGSSEAPLKPVRVCDILGDLSARDGKVVAVLGRFSFRENGRFLSEDGCERTLTAGDSAWPNALRVVFDPKAAPALPPRLELDAADVYQPLKLVRQRTALGKFRFGSVDYDRWAVVFGRIEVSGAIRTGSKPAAARNTAFEPAPAQIVCGGESAVLVIADPER